MMKWYDQAVFYHIYPLGLCGCTKENTGIAESHFDQLKEWAEHAAKLNCTAIYIGPLFESVGHGYETTDYRRVDCRLGTNDDFRDYVAYCHKLGLRVIVDGVFNHVGREFFAFKDVQQNREQSPYCSWFCNLNFGGNNEYNDGFSYENWGGYNLLVKLNQQNPEVQNYIFDAIRFWVAEFDIDGIRLDAADVLDHGFMHAMRQMTDAMKPDFWLMGEVIHGDYSRWVNDGMLHSVTNYELHKGLYSGHNDHNYFEIAHSVKRLLGICGDYRLYTFMDNHDVERIYSKLNNKEHMGLVTLLVYTLYGIPSMYYGSEFGIEGKKEQGSDWNLRPHLELADYADAYTNNPITALCVKLGELKKQYPDYTVVAYINTTSELKTLCDVCVTSASAVSIVKKLENDKILFIPDCNLGAWVAEQIPEKTFKFVKGGCPTHLRMGKADVAKAKKAHPNAKLLVHPECAAAVTKNADYIGSTTGIMSYAKKSTDNEFIIGTENSIVSHLQYECPDKLFYPLSKDCVCHNMKLTTLVDVYNCLKGLAGEEIILPEEVSKGAKRCIDRMLELN